MRVILETGRLRLRQFTAGDANALFELNGDPLVMRYLTGGKATPRAEIEGRVLPRYLAAYGRSGRLGTWAAESGATGEFLGWFHLRPGLGEDARNLELGYRLRSTAWNKGYATEGSRRQAR
ncbi:MAG TPA: GNAT family N-acetyltransferase [Streptosporangiaceae bacterium]|nr:GNAT family N-acetyltransferase [Streptosporangiaceae bacterium]